MIGISPAFNIFKTLTMKTLVKIYAIIIASVCITTTVSGQQTTKQAKEAAKTAAIKGKIDAQKYTFNAEYALPMRGGQKYLTSDYDLRITKDSVIAYLPYFGRVYMSAPITPEENGIMFTSTKFGYKVEPKKKGGWLITITPANVKYVAKLMLDVSPNGTVSLTATSNYRDEITFTGSMKE
jgi:Domain of unknown function (DUF4251)